METTQNQNSERVPISSTPLFGIGSSVRVADGASEWMKQHGFWINDWPESIDGMEFTVAHDYTHIRGDSAHYWLENETVKDCGVHPQFIIPNVQDEGSAPSTNAATKKDHQNEN